MKRLHHSRRRCSSCLLYTSLRHHVHTIGILSDLDHPLTGPELGSGLNRLLHKVVIETIAHDHVGDRLRGFNEQRILPTIDKLDAIDRLFNNRFEAGL